MEFDLLGKNILIAKIVAEARQRCRIIERHRAQTAVLGKIDGEMAGNSGAAAIANKDDLVVAIMGLMRRFSHPLATLLERDRLPLRVSDFGAALQPLKRCKISIELFTQRVIHFIEHVAFSYLSKPVRPLIKAGLSIERR